MENVQPVSSILEPGVCIVADCFIQGVKWLADHISMEYLTLVTCK